MDRPGPLKNCSTRQLRVPSPFPVNVTVALETINAGALLAAGEALHRLPPIVAMLRSCTEPITRIDSARAEYRCVTEGELSRSRKGVAAPM